MIFTPDKAKAKGKDAGYSLSLATHINLQIIGGWFYYKLIVTILGMTQ